MIKFGVTSLTFKQFTPEQIVEAVKNSSADGIEWGENENHIPLGDLLRAGEIGELTRSKGLEVFSFGSYYTLGEPIENFEITLQTALALGAPIIRIWAGKQSPSLISQQEFDNYIVQAKFMGDIAKKSNVQLCFEYHKGTLTETAVSAKKLVTAIDHSDIGLYWQPNFDYDFDENLAGLKSIIGFVTKNIHIHNYNEDAGYKNLCEVKSEIVSYLNMICQQNKDFNIIIEFVKGASVENFLKDLQILKTTFPLCTTKAVSRRP